MSKYISKLTRWLYARIAKPILFRQKPDTAHARLIAYAKHVQVTPVANSLPTLWSYSNPSLEIEVAGIKFTNPIGLSAGFDKAVELPIVMKAVGFGWMTGGSVTLGEYSGNERPWFHRLPANKSLAVNAGLPSEGASVVAQRVAGYGERLFADFPLSVSVAKTNTMDCAADDVAIDDYCQSLAEFDQLQQVKLLEINISCPNTFGGEPFTSPKRLDRLLKAVDDLRLKKPIFIKMPIDLTTKQYDALLDIIVSHSVAGVAIGNLRKNYKTIQLEDDPSNTAKGGLSGEPTKKISTDLVRYTYNKYGNNLTIIGIGGVMDAKDAYEKICAGASLVALITGLIYEGPQLIGEINRGLDALLKRDGFASIADAIGSKK